jgi:ornithine carbamoyltransferase
MAQKDWQCAMAYWGEAMSLFHPLFEWPDNETLKKGSAYVEQAAKVRVKTDRERAYIRAAVAFYQDNPASMDSAMPAAHQPRLLA